MAKSNPQGTDSARQLKAAGWARLTWDHLDLWAGIGAVSRGKAYQKEGRVKDLKVSEDGELLATVKGTQSYATTVSLEWDGKKPFLESGCTCPVHASCKHAVATVAECLGAIAEGRTLPIAAEDDRRWAKIDDASIDDWERDDDKDWDDDEPDDLPRKNSRIRNRSALPRKSSTSWDEKVRRHLQEKSQEELADLAWSLASRFPEVYREFRERIELAEGDGARLDEETRQTIRQVTSESAWRDPWNNLGNTPDYSQIRHRFERLLELGHADEVVSLGRSFIRKGIEQASQSDDEGETLGEFSQCLPALFQAVARSSLPGPKRLLFAIDAELLDEYGVVGGASALILDASSKPEDWSKAADALLGRLPEVPVKGIEDDFSSKYRRDKLTDWIAKALHESGRNDELLALYETEARITGSYERLVNSLVEAGRFEEAERWAVEGIVATGEKSPGIGAHLAATLADLARKRNQWDLVAAHAARLFFDRPNASTFDDLIQAAKAAGVEDSVRSLALSFLETGVGPFRVVSTPSAKLPTPRPKPSSIKLPSKSQPRAVPAEPESGEPPVLMIAEAWPLPMPDYLIPLMVNRSKGVEPEPRPHLEVLLDMAIAAKEPAQVLYWYDKIRAQPRGPGFFDRTLSHADRVAEAVVSAFPDRSIAIYRAALDAQLPQAKQSAYESATGYLRKLRPVYETLGQIGEWEALVTSIREKYRNRPRFLELLDRLGGRPIVEPTRTKRN